MNKFSLFKTAVCLFPLVLSGCRSQGGDMFIPKDYKPEVEGLCFNEEGEFIQIYNYCPSVIVDGDYAHIYYCSNKDSGVVGDHIAYREGRRKNGVWYWSPKSLIMGPGEKGEWDSGNVCDPDVIKGEFKYDDHTYQYLMTYLGCTTTDNSSNAFGFAVADNPAGPWIKCSKVGPLYDFYADHPNYVYEEGVNEFIWGWGQSSMISVDKKGKVLLFFTGRSTTGQSVELYDFSDMNNPKLEWHYDMSNKNIVDLNGAQDTICNAQLVYDDNLKCFYMLSDVHPFDANQWPTNLPLETRVTMINDFGSEQIGDCFKNPNALWVNVESLGEDNLGYPRIHNTCFERDPYGHILSTDSVDIFYTMAQLGADWKVLYTYRIHRYTLKF